MQDTSSNGETECQCAQCSERSDDKGQLQVAKSVGNHARRRKRRGRKARHNIFAAIDIDGTNYDVITSVGYLHEKYGLKKSHFIEQFIKCIHKKLNIDVSRIKDEYVENLDPWVKVKLFLLLVTLSERGGPDYWLDKNDKPEQEADTKGSESEKKKPSTLGEGSESSTYRTHGQEARQNNRPSRLNGQDMKDHVTTLTEQLMQKNINQDFTESSYDENYVFSSIWANFMEGLINHYLEKVIVPHSEMKVCQQLYKPMMKIISLYNEYNELMEKSERNGFLPALEATNSNEKIQNGEVSTKLKFSEDVRPVAVNNDDIVSRERLQRAQKLLWQARKDIPKTISKELSLLSEMYSTLSADEQDYELDEFVCCAEEYIELEYLPGLVEVLFKNCGSNIFWKIMLVLEPFFYYIEDVGDGEDEEEDLEEEEEGEEQEEEGNNTDARISDDERYAEDGNKSNFKPDPRVITLEKICEVAARQKWI